MAWISQWMIDWWAGSAVLFLCVWRWQPLLPNSDVWWINVICEYDEYIKQGRFKSQIHGGDWLFSLWFRFCLCVSVVRATRWCAFWLIWTISGRTRTASTWCQTSQSRKVPHHDAFGPLYHNPHHRWSRLLGGTHSAIRVQVHWAYFWLDLWTNCPVSGLF